MSRPFVLAVAASILFLLGATPVQAQVVPPTIDLGTLGGSSSHAFGINRDGVVVGDSATFGNLTTHAFIWTQAGGMVDVGTLGGTFSTAFGINSSGLVVGYSYVAGNSMYHPFVWTPATGMLDLGTLGGPSGAAQAVSDTGVVVGYSQTPDNRSHAFKWTQAGGMVDLGGLGGPNVGATAINSHGDIVGYSSITAFLDRHAVLWPHTGGITDLGTLGGSSASATGINDALVVVGSAATITGVAHAFRWTLADGLVDLGTLGGLTSYAYAVDNSGSIVGESDPPSGLAHGFWRAQDGAMTELVGLVDTFAGAAAVNNTGTVVGRSRSATGSVHATLWDLANTTSGTDVSVAPMVRLPDGSSINVALTFDTVTRAGVTSVTASSTGSPPPSGFKLTTPAVYYEITTTAQFTGAIRVCLNWVEGQVAIEDRVRLFQEESGHWADITDSVSRQTMSNSLCGVASNLSSFTLFDEKLSFTGFFQPVDNLPTVNSVKAGSAVPVKFSLNGDQGLNIFASGYPRAELIQCQTGAQIDAIEETVYAGNSTLTYDTGSGRYMFVWKTDKAWGGSCRELQIKLIDGEVYSARFTLSR